MHCPECNDSNRYRGYFACAVNLPFACSRRQLTRVAKLIDTYKQRALPGFEDKTNVPVLLPEDFFLVRSRFTRLTCSVAKRGSAPCGEAEQGLHKFNQIGA
jgi:hypothetical protein